METDKKSHWRTGIFARACGFFDYFLFFSVHFRFFSPLFVTDMSPIVKEYRRILLRITTVFFFGFRKSSRYFLSAVLKIFLSLLFFLCCFFYSLSIFFGGLQKIFLMKNKRLFLTILILFILAASGSIFVFFIDKWHIEIDCGNENDI